MIDVLKLRKQVTDIYCGIDKNIKQEITERDTLIKEAKNVSNYIGEQAVHLQDTMLYMLKSHLTHYNKNILMVSLIYLKEYFRYLSIDKKESNFFTTQKYEEILQLIGATCRLEKDDFGNRTLENGKDLRVALGLVGFYVVLVDNLNHSQISNKGALDLECYLKLGYFYSKQFDKYMDDFMKIINVEYPEDTAIKTEIIKQQMKKVKLDREQIENELYKIIDTYFGFSYEQLDKFYIWALKNDPPIVAVYMDKGELSRASGLSSEIVESIVKTFSINNICSTSISGSLSMTSLIELRSIYEFDGKIFFPPLDMFQNVSCFEKFMLKRHFVEYFSCILDDDSSKKLKNNLDHIEGRMSSYVAYILLNKLYMTGYKLPIKDGIPYPEVKSIVASNKNILKNLGDIDVLALSDYSNIIYNIMKSSCQTKWQKESTTLLIL